MVPTSFVDVTVALRGEGDLKDAITPKNGGPCAVKTEISELPKVSDIF